MSVQRRNPKLKSVSPGLIENSTTSGVPINGSDTIYTVNASNLGKAHAKLALFDEA
jgi:hypothetical protein